jgi:hypothetical protein
MDCLKRSGGKSSFCEWKGSAIYYDVVVRLSAVYLQAYAITIRVLDIAPPGLYCRLCEATRVVTRDASSGTYSETRPLLHHHFGSTGG